MSSFIKFFDSKGFLIALTSLDGSLVYLTHQGKQTFPYLCPNGQNIALVLKSPNLLSDAFRYANASVDPSASCQTIIYQSDTTDTQQLFIQGLSTISLETLHNTVITAHVSPTNMNVSPMAARDASSPENYAAQAHPPSSPPSSLAQAFQSHSQCHEINCDDPSSLTLKEEEFEMSFNDCFDNAAVDCR